MNRPSLPIEIILEVTGRCRQVCPYCTGPRIPDVPLKDIIKTIDDVSQSGVKAIRITGGEPLLHPDIGQILTYVKSKKLDTIINTTAENISPALMKTIISTVDVAHISVQGYNEKTNAAYTHTKFPFLEKIRNIFTLKAHLPTVWIATVLTPSKVESFEDFLPLITKINPSAWLLQRPIDHPNEEIKQMDHEFYLKLSIKILKAQQQGIRVFISNPIPLCVTGNLNVGQKIFLGAKLDEGHLRIVYSAKGYYKPSYFIEENLGNSLKAAWEHPFVQRLNTTDYLPSLCQQCPVIETCLGGCRAMSLRAYGSAFKADPLFDPAIAQKAQSALDSSGLMPQKNL